MAAFFFQSRLVYYPSSEIVIAPNAVGLDYEEVELTPAVSGWIPPAGPF